MYSVHQVQRCIALPPFQVVPFPSFPFPSGSESLSACADLAETTKQVHEPLHQCIVVESEHNARGELSQEARYSTRQWHQRSVSQRGPDVWTTLRDSPHTLLSLAESRMLLLRI